MAEENEEERYIPKGEPAYKVSPRFALQRNDDPANPQVLLAIETTSYFEGSTVLEEKTLHLIFENSYHLQQFVRAIDSWLADH